MKGRPYSLTECKFRAVEMMLRCSALAILLKSSTTLTRKLGDALSPQDDRKVGVYATTHADVCLS